MIILTKKRNEYVQQLESLQPYALATFTPLDPSFHDLLSKNKTKVLINTDALKKTPPPIITKNWKTNNKIHLKLAIGKENVYVGSWNFSKNSTHNMHEVGIILPKKEHQKECQQLEDYFFELYNSSTNIKKGDDDLHSNTTPT